MTAQDAIYFDENWEITTKEKHSYYRPIPLKKLGNVFLLRDFYKNGNLQMQGYITDEKDESSYVGDIFWYDKNGLDESVVKYYNKTSTKELVYYYSDNSIWKKINYNNKGEKSKVTIYYKNKPLYSGTISDNKKYNGVFSIGLQDDYYLDSKKAEPIDNIAKIDTLPPPPPILYVKDSSTENSVKGDYKTIIYWKNGKKAEEITYGYNDYQVHQKSQKTIWNQEGTQLFSIDLLKRDQPKDYKEFTYYKSFDFAQHINTEKTYKNYQLVESKIYSIDGKLNKVEKYLNGQLIESNDLSNNKKSTYKNGQPWDGEFEDNLGDRILIYNLVNGVKVNQEFVKDFKTNEIIYKGDYKDGKPWNGLFIIEKNGGLQLLQYKNGKQDGIQKVFTGYSDVIIEEYEMKNGLRDGYRKQYNNRKLITESQYKNDKIIDGTISEDDIKSAYTNGKIIEKIFYSKYSGGIERKEKYVNNELSTIEYHNFTIVEDEKDFYEATYKNRQPYEGYFLNDSLINSIPLVDYYKKGELTNQYSFDFLNENDSYQHRTFDIKSTFINGKIAEGSQFKMIGNSAFIKEEYKNKKMIGFDVNLFAMHYFNKISFQSIKNEIIISELDSPYKIKIDQDNLSSVNLFENDNLLYSTSSNEVKEGTPNSYTIFYVENNTVKKYNFTENPLFNITSNNKIILTVMNILPEKNESKKDYLVLLNETMENLIQSNFNYEMTASRLYNFPFDEKDIISNLYYNNEGKKDSGYFIENKSDNSFIVDYYRDGKKISTQHIKSVKDLLNSIKPSM